MTVGERIHYCRVENHMTQKELGEKTGIDGATIGKYERGVLNPKFETLNRIAAALEVPWTTLYPSNESAAEAYINAANDFMEKHPGGFEKITPDEAAKRGLIDNQAADSLNAMQGNVHSSQMLKDFAVLNTTGQAEAAKRVHELTFLPEYRKDPTEK